jgi:hypothetical protein
VVRLLDFFLALKIQAADLLQNQIYMGAIRYQKLEGEMDAIRGEMNQLKTQQSTSDTGLKRR